MNSPSVPTFETIAAKVGVSISTVSRALRGDHRISKATSRRVREAAEALGYRPNPLIAALMSHLRTTKPPDFQSTIAYIDTSSNPVETQRWSSSQSHFQSACDRALQLGYSIDRFWFHDPVVSPKQLVKILFNRGVHGLIIHYLPTPEDELHRLPMDVSQFAIASLGAKMNFPQLHYACTDHYAVMELALRNLQELGYQRIGVAMNAYVENIVEGRFLGAYLRWQQSLAKNNRVAPLVAPDFNMTCFAQWFHSAKPDAIVCINTDVLAWLKRMKISVPAKVGVAHLDRGDDTPTLAGVRQQHGLVAASAVDLIVGQLHRNERGVPEMPKAVLIGGEWVAGETIRNVPAKVPKRVRAAKSKNP